MNPLNETFYKMIFGCPSLLYVKPRRGGHINNQFQTVYHPLTLTESSMRKSLYVYFTRPNITQK